MHSNHRQLSSFDLFIWGFATQTNRKKGNRLGQSPCLTTCGHDPNSSTASVSILGSNRSTSNTNPCTFKIFQIISSLFNMGLGSPKRQLDLKKAKAFKASPWLLDVLQIPSAGKVWVKIPLTVVDPSWSAAFERVNFNKRTLADIPKQCSIRPGLSEAPFLLN